MGALICWENYMPLARYLLYEEGGILKSPKEKMLKTVKLTF